MNNPFKKIFEINIFFANVFIPLAILALYCISFTYVSSRLLLEGVTYHFVNQLGKYVTFGAVILFFIVLLKVARGEKLFFKRTVRKYHFGDLLFLLLPLTPIVQYALNNRNILSPLDFLYTVVLFGLFSVFYIFAVPTFLGIFIPNKVLIALGVAFAFVIANMASASNQFAWFEVGELWIQLSFFAVVFFTVLFLYILDSRRPLYIFIVITFVLNAVVHLVSKPVVEVKETASFEGDKLLPLVKDKTPAMTPNIYLLVYDAYVPNETMLGYGIDNSLQEQYLKEQKFTLYPHTYSTGAATIPTMSSVLNASTDYYGSERRAVSGDSVTHKVLRDLGYETYGVFWSDYFFLGDGENYDYSFPESSTPPYALLLKAIFLGEFRFDIQNVGYREVIRDQFVETKRDFFEDLSLNQGFIYMHSDLPSHSQNSGVCLPDEIDLFEKRLVAANAEMKQDVDLILNRDPDAIVIIAGDHGPYLTKNCYTTTNDISEITRLDIQDRHGTFLAIRWPTGDFEEYDDIVVLQDLFPSVFSYLYKDQTILEAKIEPIITAPYSTSGASVNNGIIIGGFDDGESLYLFGD